MGLQDEMTWDVKSLAMVIMKSQIKIPIWVWLQIPEIFKGGKLLLVQATVLCI